MGEMVTLKLTPIQAKILFNTIDGAADAGSCEGGCTQQELQALGAITKKLIAASDLWRGVKLDPA